MRHPTGGAFFYLLRLFIFLKTIVRVMLKWCKIGEKIKPMFGAKVIKTNAPHSE